MTPGIRLSFGARPPHQPRAPGRPGARGSPQACAWEGGTAELQLQRPQVVRMQTRPPNLEGKGEADERALLRNAPRMRRVRIIVGVSRPAASPALRALQQAAKI